MGSFHRQGSQVLTTPPFPEGSLKHQSSLFPSIHLLRPRERAP